MAMIYTAELRGEHPFEYLVALFVHSADVAVDPAAWLPWTFRATRARVAPSLDYSRVARPRRELADRVSEVPGRFWRAWPASAHDSYGLSGRHGDDAKSASGPRSERRRCS
jgi:hypothetical protein